MNTSNKDILLKQGDFFGHFTLTCTSQENYPGRIQIISPTDKLTSGITTKANLASRITHLIKQFKLDSNELLTTKESVAFEPRKRQQQAR